MGTMTLSLPDSFKPCVDARVDRRAHGTNSEHVRELIRADRDRPRLRKLLLDGAASSPTAAVDETYFCSLRNQVRPAKAR